MPKPKPWHGWDHGYVSHGKGHGHHHHHHPVKPCPPVHRPGDGHGHGDDGGHCSPGGGWSWGGKGHSVFVKFDKYGQGCGPHGGFVHRFTGRLISAPMSVTHNRAGIGLLGAAFGLVALARRRLPRRG
jgi:hypothetical protein